MLKRHRFIVPSPDQHHWFIQRSHSAIGSKKGLKHIVADRRKNGSPEPFELHLDSISGLKIFDRIFIKKIGCNLYGHASASH